MMMMNENELNVA